MSNSVLGIVIINRDKSESQESFGDFMSDKEFLDGCKIKISSELQAGNQTIEWIEVIDSGSVENGSDKESITAVEEMVASGFVKFVLRKRLPRSLRDSALNINLVRKLSDCGSKLIEVKSINCLTKDFYER